MSDRGEKPADPGCGWCYYIWVEGRGWTLSVSFHCPDHLKH